MKKDKIAIIGLGYVGLPLARLFATRYSVVGFDINKQRVSEIMSGVDSTLEVNNKELLSVLVEENYHSNGLFCSNNLNNIKDCNYYIITVPTPVDKNNRPILTPLLKASETVGSVLKKGDIVIYESTVYPGATEDDCVPVLEKVSNLKFNKDFNVGYSPERINPGDKEHTVEKILKVTSGSTPKAAQKVNDLYKSVITAGTHLTSTIKEAEASKVIENSQRDINIAFVNELTKIFDLMGIDTNRVLEAAGTKWNFLKFKPGLVGGHCIGVDPYYLAQKAIEVGYHPEIILAGRRINDSMSEFVVSKIIKLMISKNIKINNSNILVLGVTFKENCPDIRNSKVFDMINEFKKYKINVDIHDPLADSKEVFDLHKINLIHKFDKKKYDALVIAVAHQKFKNFDYEKISNKNSIIFDLKNIVPKEIKKYNL